MGTFYADLTAKVDTICNEWVLTKAAAVIEAITPVSTSLLIIYIAFFGLAMMRGKVEEPIQDAAGRIAKIGIIVGLGLSLGNYQTYVYNFLWNTPDAMARVLSGASKLSQIGVLDAMYDAGMSVGDKAWEKMALTEGFAGNIAYFFTALVAFASTLLLTGYGAVLIILAKIALSVLLAIGPICIVLVLFQATQKFFESWLGLAMNFVFLTIMAATAISFCNSLTGSFLTDLAAVEGVNLRAVLQMLLLAVMSVVVLAQIPSLASSLGGGAALTAMNVYSGAGKKAAGQFKRQPRYEKNSTTGRRDQVNYKSNAGRAIGAAATPLKMARKLYKASRSNKVANG
jgi:type IV secretion system protein VirB6